MTWWQTLWNWCVLGALAYGLILLVRTMLRSLARGRAQAAAFEASGGAAASATHICAECYSSNDGKTVTKGSFLVELILWLCFLIPGLIYTTWRVTSRDRRCIACGSGPLIPLSTPKGRALRKSAEGA